MQFIVVLQLQQFIVNKSINYCYQCYQLMVPGLAYKVKTTQIGNQSGVTGHHLITVCLFLVVTKTTTTVSGARLHTSLGVDVSDKTNQLIHVQMS